MKTFFKVINQGTPFGVTKQDGTTLNKCQIVLQEFGGKYENSYVCNLIGNSALLKFYPGDLILAALTFKHNEYQREFDISTSLLNMSMSQPEHVLQHKEARKYR